MKKVFSFTAALAALALLGVGCAAYPAAPTNNQPPAVNTQATQTSAKAAVAIQNFSFSPVSVVVNKGMTVVWTNNDSVGHTITVDSGNGPGSGVINPGETYAYTFNAPGTFGYHCNIHPSMKATVVVNP